MNRTHVSPARGFTRRDSLKLLGLGGAALALSPRLLAAAAAEGSLPSLTGTQPPYYRFHVGDIEAVALLDGVIAGSLKEVPFWPEAPEPEMETTLTGAFLAPKKLQLTITPLLLRTGNELVLIDTGCGSLVGPVGGRLPASLAAIGIKPEQITRIVLTHLHGDHFGGLLNGNKQPAFPNARILINRKEHEFWSQAAPDVSGVKMPEEGKRGAIASAHEYLKTLQEQWQFGTGRVVVLRR